MSTPNPIPSGPSVPTGAYMPGITGPGAAADSPEVRDFFNVLLDGDLNIEAPVSEAEAKEAITLFSVSNVLLAGLGKQRVGNEEKVDVLGILTLFYGLQDGSLSNRIVLRSRELWSAKVLDEIPGSPAPNPNPTVEEELKALRDKLDTLGEDVTFLSREARRQFNLGTANDVPGNTEFPRLFRRFADIATDPRLTLDIAAEDKPNSFTDKQTVGEAYDLLAELKAVVLQIVRSLSRYGTIATSRVNEDWAELEGRALRVLRRAGLLRFSEDLDEKRVLTVLADVTAKNLESVVQPYFALARNGGTLLQLAMEAYKRSQNELDNFERDRLVDLFQAPGDKAQYLTTRMRKEALVLKRYPLANWG